jgi:phosphate uptake regulator
VIARQILALPSEVEVPERRIVRPVLESTEAALNEALNLFIEFDSIRVGETFARLEFLAGQAREAANALSDLLEVPSRAARPLLSLIEIAHSAERMASQISNILEETVYLANGVDRRHAADLFDIARRSRNHRWTQILGTADMFDEVRGREPKSDSAD